MQFPLRMRITRIEDTAQNWGGLTYEARNVKLVEVNSSVPHEINAKIIVTDKNREIFSRIGTEIDVCFTSEE
jgi:hypothetical protein